MSSDIIYNSSTLFTAVIFFFSVYGSTVIWILDLQHGKKCKLPIINACILKIICVHIQQFTVASRKKKTIIRLTLIEVNKTVLATSSQTKCVHIKWKIYIISSHKEEADMIQIFTFILYRITISLYKRSTGLIYFHFN